MSIGLAHGSVKADAVLVLPKNFGWGMRNPMDSIWGLRNTNDMAQQIWAILHDELSAHG